MNRQSAVAALLRDCERALDTLLPKAEPEAGPGEAEQREFRRCQALLPEELRSLLEEAKEMKWPFVPERWQYKQDLGPEDKTNLQDMISARLPDLLAFLKASILAGECSTAVAAVFLLDRFLYWIDGSRRLLRIAQGLHRLHPAAPVSPQLLIRRARLALSAGKLLKAEYILSSLINDNGATGTWRYTEESDRILVQAVCLQIRGQILQKLGMWYEAAELIWASVVGYFKLPQPDKKGIATSLGIMADIFSSMNEQDYARFKTSADIDLSLLQEFSHRLLSAAEACKLAAAYSQYTPLFVLTAVNIRGMCLLSYSHSKDCPPEKREFYLSEAKESFEIGLLTKEEQSAITSKQELHSFIKAAFCLATVHRWLHGESQELQEVTQLCREALAKLHSYSTLFPEEEDKGRLAEEIMSLIATVKKRLRVGSFPNSDARSYVPDSYKGSLQKPVLQGETSFEEILAKHSQHHLSVCQVFEKTCRIHKTTPGEIQVGACITTLRTETKTMDTVCTTEDTVHQRRGAVKILNSPTAGSSSEGLSGQRNQDIGSGMMKISFGEEKPLEMKINSKKDVFSRGQNGSQSTTSENSQCKLSKSSYSSSWEELSCNSSRESLRDGQQGEQGSVEEWCCTTESDGDGQDGPLSSLPPRDWHPAPPESLHGSGGSPQHSLEGCAPPARKMVEKESLCREELQEGRHHGRSSSEKKAKGLNNEFPSLSTCHSVPTGQEEEKCFSCTELSCRTKDSSREEGFGRFEWVHAGELADSTEDPSFEAQPPRNRGTSVPSTNIRLKTGCDSSVHDWVRKPAVLGSKSLQVPQVDTQAETIDDTDFELISVGDLVSNYPTALAPKHEAAPSVPTALPFQGKISPTKHFDCATTEEDEEKSQDVVSSKRQSSSSLSSWVKPAQMPTSSPEGSVPRGGGFAFMPGRMKEEILDARFLRDDDYKQLLAGVEHNWLVQRLMPTGIFRTKKLHKAYSALLLKYSKKSGLWTGQETAVFIGDYLNVAKEGKQRRAFWIHFLHQEESLGRYVGKEYKEEKGLLHHFSDVERQMTAQYYVTEFNKRLYEQKVPTQIFYIPSAVLLILEDRTIKGCVSVEPYILGEFVKLSNNTKVVKNEYKATEYGLAYGHFSYEFSKGTDVVVDLQGWVTGNGKGLIYLTDPQIHSLNSKDISRSNFGKKGIYYFFNDQHVECNEICSCLSLRRPSVELLA
ncbi:alpha-protein kinase 1 [Oenanthe melanoleuca]|uniref:alpha-protein kinase 1 n=1 Tax=Oenanthe melanoleuca TaxID=2939378 RepID=UPI0024C11678|nr:alpha-protein kinase 1 [Oenanthe melanoleuca]XP_056345322.1 alpha-protein kinase 1 [Oenanthe melanoleuca]XP_056345323.1 alpha-protein kinase 1 [Oenanthe melanoleuca]XP_056345324.1 alpha-protein kinase 1 [Oenanthe melanoleuca]XP_056345326.1 alpha-protein kinase 1 [Oenanthe melanoleuca]XP_056345327.1 alpha-protein kinase 1 [Oenanthe melanoleuca]XP_056345328.1 alpha-protein kinase 1 [Oenanthe melanoleuca]XP_056345329.1 alpha-protein kinase 1 [Oenanthe melanoleuca]XP_056345330.1 alpha-protei